MFDLLPRSSCYWNNYKESENEKKKRRKEGKIVFPGSIIIVLWKEKKLYYKIKKISINNM